MKEALKLALEALEYKKYLEAQVLLRQALAQPEQEPVLLNGLTEAETNSSASVMGLTRHMQPEQGDRRLQIAMRQWEDWKTYALELQKKLVKYEGGSPMLLNAQTERPWVGLTDEERASVLDSVPPDNMGGEYYDKEITAIAIAIEAKLKEKNT